MTLKDLGRELDLSPGTISVVLNERPAAAAIPEHTQKRIRALAAERGYSPNLMARSLRNQRSGTVGVLVPEIVGGYAAGVIGGLESYLMARGYLMLVASHRSDAHRLRTYVDLFRGRQVDGLVTVNTPLASPPDAPTVAVAGHQKLDGVSNVALDHMAAARLALGHLAELGHRDVAFFRGHPGSADTEDRWRATLKAAEELGLEVRPELTIQLDRDHGSSGPEDEGYAEGYLSGQRLLEAGRPFTALVAFNDISAIGAMRAFVDAGLSVPERLSVIGFDDIPSAAFHNPGLTTVRQPLREMGELAARTLLDRLADRSEHVATVLVGPDLVIRGSTARVPPGHLADRPSADPATAGRSRQEST